MLVIHILRDGKQFGPYSEEEVRQHFAQGSLLPTDLAWHEGRDGWIPLKEFLEAPKWQPPPPPAPIPANPGTSQSAQKSLWGGGVGVVIVLAVLLYFCSPYLPTQIIFGPKLPENYGCYVKKGDSWVTLSSPEGISSLESTPQPELLIFDRRLGMAPAQPQEIVQFVPSIYVRDNIEKVMIKNDQPPDKYTMAKAGRFVPSNKIIPIGGRPVKDHTDMLLVSPNLPLERGYYTLTMLDEKASFSSGGKFLKEEDIPKSLIVDKWYTTITDKGFSWDGWFALTQKNLGEERQYNNRSIVSIEYKEPAAYDDLLTQLKNEFDGYNTSNDLESMIAYCNRVKELDSGLYQNATTQLVSKAKTVLQDAANQNQWPIVKGISQLLLDSGISSEDILSANNHATEELTQIENDSKAKVLSAIDDSKKVGDDIASFSFSDYPMGQTDSFPMRVTTNGISYKMPYSAGAINLSDLSELTKKDENSSWDSHRVYHVVTIKTNNNGVDFPFIDEDARNKSFDTILKARQDFSDRFKASFQTDVVAYPKYWSEHVYVKDCSYSLSADGDSVRYEVVTDRNEHYTVEPSKDLQISSATTLQFRSLLGSPIHIHIQRFPWNLALAYLSRGMDEQQKGGLDAAFSDFGKAIEVKPGYAEAYLNRGLVKKAKGDFNGALDDLNQAVEGDTKNPFGYFNRGHLKEVTGDSAGALADFRQFTGLIGDNYQREDYAYLYMWLIRTQQGTDAKSDIDQELSDYLVKRTNLNMLAGDWVSKIGDFLLDRSNESDFIAATNTNDPLKTQARHCEAWYFAGIKHLLANDKAGAIDYFHRSLATNQTDYLEYDLASAELKQLGESVQPAASAVTATGPVATTQEVPQTEQASRTPTTTVYDETFPFPVVPFDEHVYVSPEQANRKGRLKLSDVGLVYWQDAKSDQNWPIDFSDIIGFKSQGYGNKPESFEIDKEGNFNIIETDGQERSQKLFEKVIAAYDAWAKKYPAFAKVKKLFGPTLKDSDQGILITSIFPGSPADVAQIKVGDMITKLDGGNTVGMKAAEFVYELRQKDSHDIEILSSDGSKRTVHIQLAYPWTFKRSGN